MQQMRSRIVLCALCAVVGLTRPAAAQERSDDSELTEEEKKLVKKALEAEEGEVILIEAEPAYIPVASRRARAEDFAKRPHPRPADILRVVPGIFVNQHAGGGKSNQYFLRGFDADHGTDIALSFDGIPANMVSHGHGQGYADLNWIIPELVESIDTFKGTYSPRLGDFATAGSVNLDVGAKPKASSVALTSGRFNTYRTVGIVQGKEHSRWRPMAALELYGSDGPFENGENHRRYSAYTHAQRRIGSAGTLKVAATSYMASWNGSGQLPLREVQAGRLSRFGAVDPTEGGESQRHSGYAKLQLYPTDKSELSALVYLVNYRLNLFSNFTFFSANPASGDQIEQSDQRWYSGFSVDYRLRSGLRSIPFVTTVGLQGRGDLIDNGLFDSIWRERGMSRVDAEVRQGSIGAYAQEDVAWTPWLRSVVGARVDSFGFQVTDRLDDNSGSRGALRFSPKASLVLSALPSTDFYLNAGLGFHSNDARALVRSESPGTPMTRALGYEAGARTRLADRIDLAGSLWALDLDQETVWVGDEGTTEARGPTRRLGIEVEARAAILDWLHVDADVTLSRARFRDEPEDANRIPLAPRFTLTSGVTAQHPKGVFGRFGVRSLSDRPLTEDEFLIAEGFTLLDLTLGYRRDRYEVTLAVDNLLNSQWREAQFATSSRLASEADTMTPPPTDACPAGTRAETTDDGSFSGCEDVHFTPGYPLNLMLTACAFF